jgi:hypothetical protein
MSDFPSQPDVPPDVWTLLEAVCEQRLTRQQSARLEQLVLADPAVRRLYVDYIALHGTLHWEAAMPAEFAVADDSNPAIDALSQPVRSSAVPQRRRWPLWGMTALAACALVLVGAIGQKLFFPSTGSGPEPTPDGSQTAQQNPEQNGSAEDNGSAGVGKRKPIELGPDRRIAAGHPKKSAVIAPKPVNPNFDVPAGGSSLDAVVAYIDSRLEVHWRIDGIQPSEFVADAEWVRRAYLDLIGRIPTVEEVEQFVKDGSADKHRKLIDRLLDEPRYVRHMATVWSNLLVGRKPARDVDRPALEKFLRDSFARNRPWKEIVTDLVSAEGTVDENGAANFLVAHLNNQAVPATAVTARLFLGMQVQCTQCHNHPFNGWKQNQFWEFNAFFKQAATERKRTKSGRGPAKLVNRPKGGPTYYDRRDHVVHAAYPKFAGANIDPEPGVNRRAELARLMFETDDQQAARAFVNRTWAQFFGHAFTRPIDDMGPHNPPTHPELLHRLTAEFVASGYDVKRLVRWICNSRAYRFSSRFNDTNREDDPSKGHLPLFSRMYVKPMSPEQLYDSLLVATRADRAVKGNWDDVARQRSEWLRQFFQAYQTEENDESTTFDGTIPQALVMMNGPLVDEAVGGKPGTLLHEVLTGPGSDLAKLRRLCVAALSRQPTEKELTAVQKMLRRPAPRGQQRQSRQQVLQDMFWAYLNSNEFILVH